MGPARPRAGAEHGHSDETARWHFERVSFDAHQLKCERVGERAIVVSLLSQQQRIAVKFVGVSDEHAWTHHRGVLRSDRSHRDYTAWCYLICPGFADEWSPHRT